MNENMSDALQRLSTLSDQERFVIGRLMRGEGDADSIRRGDVHEAVRSLRTDPVPSQEYQKALADVQRLVSRIKAIPQQINPSINP